AGMRRGRQGDPEPVLQAGRTARARYAGPSARAPGRIRGSRPVMRACRRTAGFTLLELLVAVALMAILAVLSWRGLDSVLASREHITAHTDETRAVSVLFSQLDEDLRRSWPLPHPDALGRRPVAVVRGDVDGHQ